MIVSHYSTTYIALAIFMLTCIITFFYKKHENMKIKREKIHPSKKTEFYLTGILVLLLLVFGFLWYSQATPISNGFIDFTHKSISNLGNMFSKEVQADGQSSFDQFKIFKKTNHFDELQNYSKEIVNKYNQTDIYNKNKYNDYTPSIRWPKSIPSKLSTKITYSISYFEGLLIIFLGKILIIAGILYLIFNKKYKKYKEHLIITFISLLILCLIVILPFITIRYDLIRTYQQILILLSVSEIFGMLFIFKYFKKRKYLIISLLLIIYFLFLSSFFIQLIGGTDISMRTNNFGGKYDKLYVHDSEYLSGLWLISNNKLLIPVNIDSRAGTKLYLSNIQLILLKDILPYTISSKNYVYSTYANTQEQITFKSYRGTLLSFNFPTEFLNENKNKVYNNGESEIFK